MKNSWKLTIILISMSLNLEIGTSHAQQTEIPVYKNPVFPVKQRIDDLISRMTLEEKVGQMNIPCCYKTELGWGLGVRHRLWETKTEGDSWKDAEMGVRDTMKLVRVEVF